MNGPTHVFLRGICYTNAVFLLHHSHLRYLIISRFVQQTCMPTSAALWLGLKTAASRLSEHVKQLYNGRGGMHACCFCCLVLKTAALSYCMMLS